jgi:hypothetical protein
MPKSTEDPRTESTAQPKVKNLDPQPAPAQARKRAGIRPSGNWPTGS